MVSGCKRRISSSQRSVSPPAVRQRLSRSASRCGPKDIHQTPGIRIFSWNVNGTAPLLQKQLSFQQGAESPLRAFLKRHGWPHFLCLQEVKIKAQDTSTQRQLLSSANYGRLDEEPSFLLHFSLPRDRWNATGFGGKVYGVATLIREDIASSVSATRRPTWDLEGRVLVHELDIGLVLINGYWVNGTSNPYRHPSTGKETGTRHDHKLRFHELMLSESKYLEAQGKHVILIGDMNVACGALDGHPNLRTSPVQHVRNRADFNEKFLHSEDGFRGVDVFRDLHGSIKKFTYYPRGVPWGKSCDRVDNIIVSRTLKEANAVLAADICDNLQDRGHSDHVPLWVHVDLSKIPGRSSTDEASPSQLA